MGSVVSPPYAKVPEGPVSVTEEALMTLSVMRTKPLPIQVSRTVAEAAVMETLLQWMPVTNVVRELELWALIAVPTYVPVSMIAWNVSVVG